MRILVTGGAGFIGGNITKRLLSENHEVSVMSIKSDPFFQNIKNIYIDNFNWSEVFNKDVVFHQLANNDTLSLDKNKMFESNVHWPTQLFHRCLEGGCKKFIYASSTAVYGKSTPPYTESTPLNPINVYGESKAKFDEFAINFGKKFNVQVIGLRYCNVYGPGEDKKGHRMSMVGKFINCILNDKNPELFYDGTQKRDWIYVNDVVDANMLAMKSNLNGIYNIGFGKSYTFNYLIKLINKFLNKKLIANYIDCKIKERYQTHTQCNIDKAKKELCFNPKFSIELGIRNYINYLVKLS